MVNESTIDGFVPEITFTPESILRHFTEIVFVLRLVGSGVSAGAIPSSGTFQKTWAGFYVRGRRSPGQNTGSIREESDTARVQPTIPKIQTWMSIGHFLWIPGRQVDTFVNHLCRPKQPHRV